MFIFAIADIQAQSFIPGSMPEYKNPFSNTPYTTFLMSELSNYHYEKVQFRLGDMDSEEVYNDLYVWTWTSMNLPPNTPACGVGWKRTRVGNPDDIIDDGFLFLDKYISSPEIAFIRVGDEVFVFLAYYQSNLYQFGGSPGHKYDIYRWDSDTLSIIDTGIVLSDSKTHTRISIDAHRLYAIGITWEYMENIYVKTFFSYGDDLHIGASQPIRNAAAGIAPDIAFSHPSHGLIVRILYGKENDIVGDYDYFVSHGKFEDLMAPPTVPIGFIMDDSSHAFTFYPAANGLDIMGHQLDCSDHELNDSWAYSYYDGFEDKIRIRLYNGAVPDTVNIDVFDPFLFLSHQGWIIGNHTLAYDNNSNKIHVGFHATKHPVPGYPEYYSNFYAASYWDDGSKTGTTLDEFKEIANTPFGPFTIPALTFSKQNDDGSQLFTSYNGITPSSPMDSAGMIHKHGYFPNVDSHFKSQSPITNTGQLLVYPNPVQQGVSQILLPESLLNTYKLNLRILDVSGRIINNTKVSAQNINSVFQQELESLESGVYYIIINTDKEQLFTQFVKF